MLVNTVYRLNSWPTRGPAGSSIEMLPYIEDMWIARMPANHACRTIKVADEMKWNEMSGEWRNGGMKYVAEENGSNLEIPLPRLRFAYHEIQIELGNPTVGGEGLTDCATGPP